VLALTAIGTTAAMDLRPQGALAQRLRSEAASLSARLGWRAPA
jgi:DNA-binding IclR family transcriptional regulator